MISQEEGRIFFEIDRRNFYIILLTKSVMCVQKCIPIFYLLLRSMITCTSRLFDSPCGPCVIAWTKEKVVISFLRPLRKRECAWHLEIAWRRGNIINNNKLIRFIWKWYTHHPGTGGAQADNNQWACHVTHIPRCRRIPICCKVTFAFVFVWRGSSLLRAITCHCHRHTPRLWACICMPISYSNGYGA